MGRDTDKRFRLRNRSVFCPTPNNSVSKTSGNGGSGVSLSRERGTTQTIVKVPKYQLSVKG